MKKKHPILFPIACLYGTIVRSHQWLYSSNVLKSASFDFPIINIGNLSVGGTGKSPHVEYIYRLLAPTAATAIVSRGYNRKTRGVQLVSTTSKAIEVGDEPLQFKIKFPEALVVVAEKRALGINFLLEQQANFQHVLLDDAFQHWSIQPSVQILLTTYDAPFFEDAVLPMGRLREFQNGAQRAHIIIVTKCSPTLSQQERQDYIQKIKPAQHQCVFFSYFEYQMLYPLFYPQKKIALDTFKTKKIVVVTGIAQTNYLKQFIEQQYDNVEYIEFPDHHYFSSTDLEAIHQKAQGKVIITTEKDATRFYEHQATLKEQNWDIYVLPIQVQFAFDEGQTFQNALLSLLSSKA